MAAFEVIPASTSDLEAVVRVQFEACASDHGFSVIFPKGSTSTSVTHFMAAFERDMKDDPTCHIVIVKDAMSGDVASYAVWHFYPSRSQEEIEQEMLIDDFPLPEDANKDLGNALIHNSIRKRHEVVAVTIGEQTPYACKLKALNWKYPAVDPCRRFGRDRDLSKLPTPRSSFKTAHLGFRTR